MNIKLISIIVPIYNAELYLHQCINSVLSQTYKRFELILIDDGSTDASLAICNNYTDTRLKVIRQENQGESVARNAGIRAATGDYIAFLDADDWWNKEFLEHMTSKLDCNKMPICAEIRVYLNGTEKDSSPVCGASLLWLLVNQYSISCQNCIFDKRIIYKKGIYFTPGCTTGEDQEFTYKYLLNVSGFCYVQKAKYYYRVNPNSIMFRAHYGHFDAVEAMISVERYANEHCEASYANEIAQALRAYKYPCLLEFAITTLLTAGETPNIVMSYLKKNGYVDLLDKTCLYEQHYNSTFMRLWQSSPNLCLWYYYIRKRVGNLLRRLNLR